MNPLRPVSANRKRTVRFVHLTDIHVQPEKGAGAGMAAALVHAQSLPDKPDFILTGGDLIMDSLGKSKERTALQWDLFQRVLKDHVRIPIEHVIGNHDVWGWSEPGIYADESKYGKVWPCEVLELEQPYRAFQRANWKFIVLDSTFPVATGGYTAKLDDAQFEWLEGQFKDTPEFTPIVVVSHIPIIAACTFFDGDNEQSGDWQVPGAWMHIDARRIKDLFRRHPNVKLCLSGHVHLLDHVVYNGVTYVCLGAVCAGWWGGDYQECTNGYAAVNLYDDGSFDYEYIPYGWQNRA